MTIKKHTVRLCTYCEKPYIKPCDGKADCPNRIAKDAPPVTKEKRRAKN
jgi:hypothetical protein